jgi:hypothetical protein
MLGDLADPLGRDASAAEDVIEERSDVRGSFRAAERNQQEGIVGGKG